MKKCNNCGEPFTGSRTSYYENGKVMWVNFHCEECDTGWNE